MKFLCASVTLLFKDDSQKTTSQDAANMIYALKVQFIKGHRLGLLVMNVTCCICSFHAHFAKYLDAFVRG